MRLANSAALATAALLLAAPTFADAPHDPADVTAGVSIADAPAIAADAGCEVERVKESDNNGFTVEMSCPGDRHPWLTTLNCTGDGDARVCTEYEIGIAFRARSAAQARRLVPKLQFKYIGAVADDDVLTFTRMDFTRGGVTRGHVAESLKVVLEMSAADIEPAIWPEPAAKPAAQ
jgi:hypothetical protein